MSEAKTNQRELILKYIADVGSITSFQAYQDLGVTQLATRIKELEERGYVFKKEIQRATNRYGKPIHFVKYTIERAS